MPWNGSIPEGLSERDRAELEIEAKQLLDREAVSITAGRDRPPPSQILPSRRFGYDDILIYRFTNRWRSKEESNRHLAKLLTTEGDLRAGTSDALRGSIIRTIA
jgi:hypothetical protein